MDGAQANRVIVRAWPAGAGGPSPVQTRSASALTGRGYRLRGVTFPGRWVVVRLRSQSAGNATSAGGTLPM